MTTISSTAAAGTSSVTAAASDTLFADYNMFLELLTTQMTNQDPLDPMDTSEYTQQLVQYSQVEQSIQQTGALQDILSQLASQDLASASNFIGRTARFDSAVAGLGDAPAQWSYYADTVPASLTATISDSSGNVVQTVTLDPAQQGTYSWDGTMSNGATAPAGAYTFAVTALDASGEATGVTINSMARVTDVVSTGSDIMLGVNGIRMSVSGLVAVSDTSADES